MLESIAAGVACEQILDDIVQLIERQAPGMLCSILLLDQGKRLKHGAAPHLPEAYIRAIDGTDIGPSHGSCGTAAYTAQRVIVEDIAIHPYWRHYKHHALPHGLVACWSTPIVSPGGDVLGTFAMYYPEARGPTPKEIEWVDVATHLASITILRYRTEERLRRSEVRARELARLHAVSASINKLLVRVRDARSLYDLACRIAVEKGLARLAWLGLVSDDQKRIDVVAQYGDVDLIDTRTLDLTDPRNGGGLLERGLLSGEPAVTHDLSGAPVYWRDELAQRGLHSYALFPLKDAERIFAVFALYASTMNYFGDEELQVLTSLAADISAGIESVRKDQVRQRMEEQVRAGENLRSLVYSAVGDGIYYLECETEDVYRFKLVNRALLELFNTSEERVIGHTLGDLMPDALRGSILGQFRRALEAGTRISWEQAITPLGGEIKHMEMTVAPIYDAQGVCTNLVGTVRDITARVHAEAERARLLTELNQAQRMQSLGTLAGGIAHDFNNILAAVSGNVTLALQEPALEPATRAYLLEVQKASRRATDLVRQILTFSRHSPARRDSVQPVDVVREALDLLHATLPSNVAIETQFAADTPMIEGDSTQLHQIVMNLGANAVHALTPAGGLIRMQLDPCRMEEGVIPGLAGGYYMRLQVTDNGCGMDDATMKRAFDPFFTTRQPGEGTGLGLSVVHGIAQSHGGAVDIRSKVNEGTTVSVYLPASTEGARPVAPVAQGHGERVMYVDDEEALVFLMERALSKMGYRVSGFSDPTIALNAFRKQPHEFDVIVTDLSMPGLSGQDLVVELRRIRAAVPIIMTSGYIRPEDVETAQRLQINQLVYKANTIEELGRALAQEIDIATRQRDQARP